MKLENDFKLVPMSSVIHLPDLILRWPFRPHVKICKEIYSGKLHTYLIIREFRSVDNEVKYSVTKLPTKYMLHNMAGQLFSAIVFMKNQVQKIESRKTSYTLRSITNSMNNLESCSIDNMNKYAPQFAYLLCKYSHNKYFSVFSESEVAHDISSDLVTLHDCMPGDRSSWIFQNSQIWPTSSPYHFRKSRRKEKDLSQVVHFCEQQKKAGITDKRALARLVDDCFPGLLTNAEMGGLLPAREGTVVTHHAKVKQGKKLRGVI
ncbi:hypothetical protein [Desulfolutivibrio sp.]|uniref:hypothetical protein n=1 Tax=Desulfolutivibrio sp. TaxID=2773296 RepID=UPI002F96AAC2